jgi:DNA-binding SARP family transcriptional activator
MLAVTLAKGAANALRTRCERNRRHRNRYPCAVAELDLRLRVNVLGPVEMFASGQPCHLSRLERTLLAALVAHLDQVVSTTSLVDALWDDNPPSSARNRIQALTSAVRRAAGPAAAALQTQPSGYLLRSDATDLDIARFEHAVAEGRRYASQERVAEADRSLASGLGLWRGEPFADAESSLVRGCALRLNELRWSAIEERVQARLVQGEHFELVGEAAQLLATQPLRQRLREQLMLALHRCGRRPEALELYRQGAALLAEEHGVDPGPGLQGLHQAILHGAPELDWTPPAARQPGNDIAQLPMAPPVFVGRESELARLDASAHSGVVTVTGGAGVGKTVLAVHWAHRVAARFPDGQLYVDLRGFDPSGSVVPAADAVRGFLDALGVAAHRVPTDIDAQTALYRSALAGKRMLVLLDNARDADQVRPLLPGTPGCMVVVTSRNELPGLLATAGAYPLRVDLMSATDARRLLARRIGADRLDTEPDATEEMIAQCGRLPLALAIVAARAASRPDFALAAFAEQLRDSRSRLDAFTAGDTATDVRAVFSWSYLALSTQAARLFRLLGLHPASRIGMYAAASLAGVAPGRSRGLLAELARAHLIAEPVPDRYVLHDLLHAYATELANRHDSQDDRRAAHRRMLDHYLHTAHAAALLLHPRRQSIIGTPPPPEITTEALSDQDHAMAWFNREHSVLVAAIGQASDIGLDTYAWRIAWALTDFLDRREHWQDLASAHQAALAAAVRLADAAGQAHAHRGLGAADTQRRRYGEARVHLDRALELFSTLEDHTAQADTLLDLGFLFERQGRHADALESAHRALALLTTVERPTEKARALNNVGWYSTLLGRHEDALVSCRQALDLFKDLDDRSGQTATLDSLARAHYHLGQYQQAIDCRRLALDLCRGTGNNQLQAAILIRLGDVHNAAGDPHSAHDAWQRAVDLLDEIDHQDADTARTKLDPVATPCVSCAYDCVGAENPVCASRRRLRAAANLL